MVKDPRLRASTEDLLRHPFIRSKAYVHLNERELQHVGGKLQQYFRTHPASAWMDGWMDGYVLTFGAEPPLAAWMDEWMNGWALSWAVCINLVSPSPSMDSQRRF